MARRPAPLTHQVKKHVDRAIALVDSDPQRALQCLNQAFGTGIPQERIWAYIAKVDTALVARFKTMRATAAAGRQPTVA